MKPRRSNSGSSTFGSGEANSTNSNPISPIGLSKAVMAGAPGAQERSIVRVRVAPATGYNPLPFPSAPEAMRLLLALCTVLVASLAFAQPCPERNVQYWQAFPPGGESDIAARHQQLVLKKKC